MKTMYEIIDTVERIRVLDREISEKEAAQAELAAAVEAEVGHKKTIARCRLREVETALGAAIEEYNTLHASIPAPDELLYGFSVGHIADLRLRRKDLQKDIENLRQLLGAEEEKLQNGPWRRKGAPLPPAMAELQLRIAKAEAAIAKAELDIVEMMKPIAAEEKAQAAARQFSAWVADETGEVPVPARVRQRRAAAMEEFMETAVRLEILTPAVMARRSAEAKAAAAQRAAEEAAAAAEAAAEKERAARPKKQSIFDKLVAKYKAKSLAGAVATPELIIDG
jgi:hypothetical protein